MTTLLESAKSTVKSHHSRMLDFFWGGRCKSASREVFQQKISIATLDGSAHFCKTSPARADTVPGRRIASLRSTVVEASTKGPTRCLFAGYCNACSHHRAYPAPTSRGPLCLLARGADRHLGVAAACRASFRPPDAVCAVRESVQPAALQ